MSTLSADTENPAELVYLDPRTLIENPNNPRSSLGDLDELAESIRAVGVLEPLIVVPSDVGGFMVMFGHRRRSAAIEAEVTTVPCIVRPEYVGKTPEQIADMLAENLHRVDLTAIEEAKGYAQLAAFEWSAEQIAQRTGRKVERVRHGLAAAVLPEEVRPHVVEGSLTLEQAAALDEFSGDPKAMSRLLKAAGHNGIHYALADERSKKEARERKTETKEALSGERVRIVPKPKGFPWGTIEVEVEQLTDTKNRKLTPRKHKSCPGHAAFIDTNGTAVYICQHPKDWGHGTPAHYRHMSTEEAAEAEAAADAQRQFDEAWEIATEARRSFLQEHLTKRGKVPAGTLRIVTDVLYGFHSTRAVNSRTVAALLGVEGNITKTLGDAAGRASDNRLPMLLLAYASAEAEDNLRSIDMKWSFSPELGERWLSTVADLGYPLSDVEVQVRERCREQIEARSQEPEEDYDDEWDDGLASVDPSDDGSYPEPTESTDEATG